MQGNMSIIVNHVDHIYNPGTVFEKKALDDVTFSVENGEYIGLVGRTGSGKSTSLAALLDRINTTRACHIITVEDPIEFVHNHKMALIEQREIHADTISFSNALKYVLRQDPDVILVGEMRDPETIATVLTAAETGHLVFATLHTNRRAASPPSRSCLERRPSAP